jgi:hypothetical protein
MQRCARQSTYFRFDNPRKISYTVDEWNWFILFCRHMLHFNRSATFCVSALLLGIVSAYLYDTNSPKFAVQSFDSAGTSVAEDSEAEATDKTFWATCSAGEETLDCLLAGCATVTDMEKGDCEALVALYNSTNGANRTQKTDWLLTNKACSWFGVVCGNKRVTYLRLQSNNLAGTIPDAFWNLTELMQLNMSNNSLSWPLPTTLGNLKKAQWVLLNDNLFSGKIPTTMGNLSSVKRLWLFNNNLDDTIPKELWSLSQLQELFLSNNAFSGPLPNELGKLMGIKKLRIDGNQFSGPLPNFLWNLPQLQDLDLSHNQFCGYLPSSFVTSRPNGLPFTYDRSFNQLIPKGNTNALQAWITKHRIQFGTQDTKKCPLTQEQSFPQKVIE